LFEAVPGIHYYGSEVSIQAAAEKVVEILKSRDSRKEGEES